MSASPDRDSGAFGPGAEATAAFLLGLRAKGIRDLAVLRALESIPREAFIPHRYADLAVRDVALPIPCGQTMSAPVLVARMVEMLALSQQSRVLEIGSGSGYATAILARIAGEVVSVERYRTLVAQARARLDALRIHNTTLLWGDGYAVPPEAGVFDRLVIHGSIEALAPSFTEQLTESAIAVYAKTAGAGRKARQRLFRAARSGRGEWVETPVCPCRLRPLEVGLSQGL